jgi:hypothetical protein
MQPLHHLAILPSSCSKSLEWPIGTELRVMLVCADHKGQPRPESLPPQVNPECFRNTPVGALCRKLPQYVKTPPVEAVVFAWGVNEDGQLGIDSEQNVATPKVVEALLGARLAGRSFCRAPLVAGSRNTLAIDSDGQVSE